MKITKITKNYRKPIDKSLNRDYNANVNNIWQQENGKNADPKVSKTEEKGKRQCFANINLITRDDWIYETGSAHQNECFYNCQHGL